eukprot:8064548-Alexandrium_andersonii.AAC.1
MVPGGPQLTPAGEEGAGVAAVRDLHPESLVGQLCDECGDCSGPTTIVVREALTEARVDAREGPPE